MKKTTALLLMLFLLFSIFCFFPFNIEANATGANWLNGWTYRKSHNINAAVSATVNYQVNITVNYGAGTSNSFNVYLNSKCKTTFADVRFTDDDGSTLLDYYCYSNTTSNNAVFWVEVKDDLSSAQVIYIYYGRADAVSVSSGSATFPLFDNFDDNSLALWTQYTGAGGTIGVSGSTLTLTIAAQSKSTAELYSLTTFGRNYAVRSRVTFGAGVTFIYKGIGFGLHDGADFKVLQSSESIQSPHAFDTTDYLLVRKSSTYYFTAAAWTNTISIFETRRISVSSTGLEIGGNSYTYSTNIPADGAWYVCPYIEGSVVGSISLDWIFVRQYVAAEPVHSVWGSEEFAVFYITFRHNSGGIFKTNGTTRADSAVVGFANTSVIELVAVVQSSSYTFLNFTWSGGSSSTNPKNYTIIVNMTIWCYFGTSPTATPYITSRYSFTPSRPYKSEVIIFDGSSSVSSSAITDYSWNFGDGNTTNGNYPTITHKYYTVNNFSVTLTITSSVGTNAFTQQVSVFDYHTPFSRFTISPTTQYIGLNVTFDASSSKSLEGIITNYYWQFGDAVTENAAIPTTKHIYTPIASVFIVNLTITDSHGKIDWWVCNVTIIDYHNPIARFEYHSSGQYVNQQIHFNATSSETFEGIITNYSWDFGDTNTDSGVLVSHDYTSNGTYTVSLTVTNSHSKTDVWGVNINITNQVIFIVARFNFNISNPHPNSTIAFDGTISVSSSSITLYNWNFGDNSTSSLSTPTHIYSLVGDYNVVLNVTSSAGWNNTSQIINVQTTGGGVTSNITMGIVLVLMVVAVFIFFIIKGRK